MLVSRDIYRADEGFCTESDIRIYLGVDCHTSCLLGVGGSVDVNRAQAIRMPHDRDASAILDVADEAVAPAWDNEIDVLVKLEQRGHLCSRLDRLDVGGRDRSFRERALDCLGEELCGLVGLLAAFQDCGVPCNPKYGW